MTTVAANITQAIAVAADNIAELSYDAIVNIKTRMDAWGLAIFGTGTPPAGGLFVNVESNAERRVIDWLGLNNMANATTFGIDPGILVTSAIIDAVIRTLCAVRDAQLAGAITAAQQTAVVTAFNAQWT